MRIVRLPQGCLCTGSPQPSSVPLQTAVPLLVWQFRGFTPPSTMRRVPAQVSAPALFGCRPSERPSWACRCAPAPPPSRRSDACGCPPERQRFRCCAPAVAEPPSPRRQRERHRARAVPAGLRPGPPRRKAPSEGARSPKQCCGGAGRRGCMVARKLVTLHIASNASVVCSCCDGLLAATNIRDEVCA